MQQQITSLSSIIAPHFHELHKSLKREEFAEYWLKGGRGSTKSSFAAIEIVLGIVRDPTANAVLFRKVGNTLRDSVHTTILWAIDQLGLGALFDAKVSPMEVIYKPTGQRIIMRGLDEPSKIKSIKLRKGYFKYLWFEEASEYRGMQEIRSVEQSILRGGGESAKFVEFFTYNPPNDPNNWINQEVDKKAPGKVTHHSSYKTVPRAWLGPTFITKAETLKENNFEAYRHEYLGEAVGNMDSIIFHGKWEVRKFDTPTRDQLYQRRFFFGADWGFSQDPNVLIRCFIKDEYLWIDHESYDRDYQELIDEGKGKKKPAAELEELPALFDKIPESRRYEIIADSSRPETISYVRRKQFFITSVKKTTKDKDAVNKGTKEGYVQDGISYIKGTFKKIIVHENCKNIAVEFAKYSFEIDKHTQQPLPDILDKYNHGIDALRYALSKYILKKATIC